MLNSVLIIDDSEPDRYLLKRRLKEAQVTCHIFESENGQAAIDFLTNFEQNLRELSEKFPPALIFVDINMPLVSGFEFLELFADLKEKHPLLNSTILMMFSSSARPEDKDRSLSYDFVKGFITKAPMNIDAFKAEISQYFQRN